MFCFLHFILRRVGDGVYTDDKNQLVSDPALEGQNLSQYIVTNCDLVRLRYLLVYAKQPASMRFPTTSVNGRNVGGLRQWLSRHKLFSILLGYGLMLATIGTLPVINAIEDAERSYIPTQSQRIKADRKGPGRRLFEPLGVRRRQRNDESEWAIDSSPLCRGGRDGLQKFPSTALARDENARFAEGSFINLSPMLLMCSDFALAITLLQDLEANKKNGLLDFHTFICGDARSRSKFTPRTNSWGHNLVSRLFLQLIGYIFKLRKAKLCDYSTTYKFSNDVLSPDTPDALQVLRTKHPPAPVNPYFLDPPTAGQACFQIQNKDIIDAILSFKPSSAAGLDGISSQHLKDLTSHSVGDAGEQLVNSIPKLINFMYSGNVNPEIVPILFGANLIALTKKDGGVRPIAVG
ncbi:hypothetical protein evm_011123 [Chilo suppressalis]|nr:hypothetical protein evm_011123 [Chilo suppressalis]